MDPHIFSIVPIEVVKDKRLTLEQTRVLVALMSFRGKDTNIVFPSRKTLAERCGMHEANVSQATTKLVELGWLKKQHISGSHKAVRFKITVPDVAHSATAQVAHSATAQVAHSATAQVAHSATGIYRTNQSNLPKEEIYVPPADLLPSADAPCPVNRAPVIPVSDVEIILHFINRKTGKAYKAKRPDGNLTANAGYIKAILKSGYTVQDCKTVFARKFNEWGDSDKMAAYLTPETIYRKKNFDKYIAECTADNPLRKAQ